jgi:hypothetical protein
MRHAVRTLTSFGLAALFTLPLTAGRSASASEGDATRVPEGTTAGLVEARQATLVSSLVFALPAPTGPNVVGVHATFLEDSSRVEPATGGARSLPVRVWYPACAAADGPPARYVSEAVQPALEAALGLPEGSFDLEVYAQEDAPMQGDPRGVILVSAGYQEPAAFQTAHVIDLASRGWVVIGVDHPHDTLIVEQPNQELITSDLTSEEGFQPRVADIGVVLDSLPELVPGWHPGIPIGMFGHSLGGSAAAEAVRRYPELLAGVDLDGSPRGEVLTSGLDKPFGAMLSTVRRVENVDDGFAAWFSGLRGPHPLVQLEDVQHDGLSDFVIFNPQASAFDPALGAALESVLHTDVPSVEVGVASLTRQRRFLAGFFARYLHEHVAEVPHQP